MTISFGDVTLDTATRQLHRGAEELRVSPKAFDLLAALVEARPRALSKADLHERLWPDTYVSESNLSGLVAEIRRAIGDDARTPRFVRTVHRYGYAFSGDATAGESRPAAGGRCWIVHGGRQWPLTEGEHILGRGQEPLSFDSTTMSRCHARVVVSGGHASIEDMGSKNGTFVHERPVTSRRPLTDGDEIRLGDVRVTFRASPLGPSTRTAKR